MVRATVLLLSCYVVGKRDSVNDKRECVNDKRESVIDKRECE